MRLIDADALIEKMGGVKFQTNISEELNRYRPFLDYADVLDCINEQPTAYDVEKVVAELGELPNREADHYYANSNDVIDREDAIDTVKRGGVE